MSMPMTTSRTNYFRVNNEEEYQKLFQKLYCGEDPVHDFSRFDSKNGVMLHGFGSYDDIRYSDDPDNEDDDCSIEGFITRLQPLLPDGEAFMLFSISNEKLQYVCGDVYIATNHSFDYTDLATCALEKAREALGNPKFDTKYTY